MPGLDWWINICHLAQSSLLNRPQICEASIHSQNTAMIHERQMRAVFTCVYFNDWCRGRHVGVCELQRWNDKNKNYSVSGSPGAWHVQRWMIFNLKTVYRHTHIISLWSSITHTYTFAFNTDMMHPVCTMIFLQLYSTLLSTFQI